MGVEIERDEGRRCFFPLFLVIKAFLGDCLEETLVSCVQGHPP